ncbi:MAG TPA: hypothetical protein VJ485_03935 [archaeon]|nr:hypothetical protein [archaeon]
MGCDFKRTQLRESLRSNLKNPEKAAECTCLQHFDSKYEGLTIVVADCGESFESCKEGCYIINCIGESCYNQASDNFYRKGKK